MYLYYRELFRLISFWREDIESDRKDGERLKFCLRLI